MEIQNLVDLVRLLELSKRVVLAWKAGLEPGMIIGEGQWRVPKDLIDYAGRRRPPLRSLKFLLLVMQGYECVLERESEKTGLIADVLFTGIKTW